MNTTTFTLTSVALGVMAGISAMHYHQVSGMVASGGQLPSEKVISAETPAPPAATPPASPPATVAQLPPGRQEIPATTISAADDAPTARESILLELLTEMRKEQKMLRAQLAETNREMSELTFRVDTHSDSFKPLRTDSARPRSLDSSPGLQTPIEDDAGLLPPVPPSRP